MPPTNDPKDNRLQPRWLLILLCSLVLFWIVIFLGEAFTEAPARYTFETQSVLNILLLAAIVIQALIYYEQWDVMKDSVDAAKVSADSLKALERADVLLERVFSRGGQLDNLGNIVFAFRNFGRSRATHVSVGAIIYASANPVHIDGNYVAKYELLAPDQPRTLATSLFSEFLSPENIDDINAGLLDLRFTGHIAYVDVFGDQTILEFTGMFDPAREAFTFDQKQKSRKRQEPN